MTKSAKRPSDAVCTVLEELRSLVILVIGCAMAVVGSKMHDDLIRSIGFAIIGTALGITVPGMGRRDPQLRTRTTDEIHDGRSSGR